MRLFDSAAKEYDAARPSYPAAVYDLLDALCGGLVGKAVADGGTGTGVVARQLIDRGANVVAFDPGPGMLGRAVLRTPGLRVVVADATAVPLRSHRLDLICFGQSWHWVEQTAGARELARILRPGGLWAAFWNHPWADGEGWFERYLTLLEARCPDFSRHQRNVDWTSEAVAALGSFDHPERHIISWERRLSVDSWLTDVRSHSYVIDLVEPDRAALLADVDSIVREEFPDGSMAVPYETRVWIARRS